MSNKNQILKLFSQPVFKYQVENYEKINSELLEYIYQIYEKDNIGVKKSNINGWHSKSFDLSDKDNIPNRFLKHINHHIIFYYVLLISADLMLIF